MSHEIHTAVFSAMEGAGWTGLGVPIPADIARDPRKIAQLCGATFNVRKAKCYREMPDGTHREIEDRSVLYRDDTGADFEIVSTSRYHIDNRQPVDLFESFRDKLAADNLSISHAAVLRGGRVITVCAKLAEPIQEWRRRELVSLQGRDEILSYLTGATGYDLQHGSNYFLTGIRTVCANTLAMGLAGAERSGRLFHASASQRLGARSLKNMLEAASTVIRSEREFYAELQARAMTEQEAEDYFAAILEVDPTDIGKVDKATGKPAVSSRTLNQLRALQSAYRHAPGAAPGSVYGALQAVTYFVDHVGSSRDTDGDGRIAARMASSLFGRGASVKLRAVQEARTRIAVAA